MVDVGEKRDGTHSTNAECYHADQGVDSVRQYWMSKSTVQ